MALRLSRRKLAAFVAAELLADNQKALRILAAYLVESGRTREAELVVRDIEDALASRGVVVAEATAARSLSAETAKAIKAFLSGRYNASEVLLETHVDPTVIGGVRIATPDAEFDSTIRHKLTLLRAKRV